MDVPFYSQREVKPRTLSRNVNQFFLMESSSKWQFCQIMPFSNGQRQAWLGRRPEHQRTYDARRVYHNVKAKPSKQAWYIFTYLFIYLFVYGASIFLQAARCSSRTTEGGWPAEWCMRIRSIKTIEAKKNTIEQLLSQQWQKEAPNEWKRGDTFIESKCGTIVRNGIRAIKYWDLGVVLLCWPFHISLFFFFSFFDCFASPPNAINLVNKENILVQLK